MATKQNLEMYRGDSKTMAVNFPPTADMMDGGTAWFTMKLSKDNISCIEPDNKCVFQINSLITAKQDTEGNIISYSAELFIPPADSTQFDIKSYFYDIQIVGASQDPNNPGYPILVKTLIEGKIKILEDVTRRNT